MTLWLILTLALASVALFAVWARFPSKARGLSLVAFLLASPAAGACLLLSMGWAVPVYLVISTPEGEFEVHGAMLVPDEAIYVMSGEPRLYALPWDAETASKLQRMMEGAEGEGKIKGKIKPNGDRSVGEFHVERPPVGVIDKPAEKPGLNFQRTE